MNPITDKQMYAIHEIERTLMIKFLGESKQDAWLWLQEYVPLAKEKYVARQGVYELSHYGNDMHNQNIGLKALNLMDENKTPTLESVKMDVAMCHALLDIL